MTEQIPGRKDAREGRLSTPERVGRAVGVALFWVPALLFIVMCTYSVVGQVFMLKSANPRPHSAACDATLQWMAATVNDAQSADDDVRTNWELLYNKATSSCGDQDPSIQEITAVLLRMQHQAARNKAAFERDQARLTRALAQYVEPGLPHHE